MDGATTLEGTILPCGVVILTGGMVGDGVTLVDEAMGVVEACLGDGWSDDFGWIHGMTWKHGNH